MSILNRYNYYNVIEISTPINVINDAKFHKKNVMCDFDHVIEQHQNGYYLAEELL